MTPKCQFCYRNSSATCYECGRDICMKHYYSGLCPPCHDEKIIQEQERTLEWLDGCEFDPYKDERK